MVVKELFCAHTFHGRRLICSWKLDYTHNRDQFAFSLLLKYRSLRGSGEIVIKAQALVLLNCWSRQTI